VGPYTDFGKAWAEQDEEFRHPTSGEVQRFPNEGGFASSSGGGDAGDGIPSQDLSFPVFGKS
jgi:hypothetical protein